METSGTKQKYWSGDERTHDDFDDVIKDTFIDGVTSSGQWGIMTERNHQMYGRGLGSGKGQKYAKQSDGRWLKVAG